jgi:hypothetical protein
MILTDSQSMTTVVSLFGNRLVHQAITVRRHEDKYVRGYCSTERRVQKTTLAFACLLYAVTIRCWMSELLSSTF